MPMYVFDSYFYQAQFLGNRSTTTFISRSRKHAHTLHAFGGGVVPNDTTLQEVKMLVPFSHPMQPLRDSEQQYDIDGAYSVSLTCDDAALYRSSMSWAGGGRRFIETQHSSGCIMSCASKNVRYNTSSSCGRCSVLEVGTATVAAYPISRRNLILCRQGYWHCITCTTGYMYQIAMRLTHTNNSSLPLRVFLGVRLVPLVCGGQCTSCTPDCHTDTWST